MYYFLFPDLFIFFIYSFFLFAYFSSVADYSLIVLYCISWWVSILSELSENRHLTNSVTSCCYANWLSGYIYYYQFL